MSLYVLDALLWILGIRGHIPQNDGLPAWRRQSSFDNAGTLTRVLAAVLGLALLLSLLLWATVWLAIKLL
jgi:hypothetical protein